MTYYIGIRFDAEILLLIQSISGKPETDQEFKWELLFQVILHLICINIFKTLNKITKLLHLSCQVIIVVINDTSHNQVLRLRRVCPLIQSLIFLFKIVNPFFPLTPFSQKSCWCLKSSAVQVNWLTFIFILFRRWWVFKNYSVGDIIELFQTCMHRVASGFIKFLNYM